jgi:hypothetical protein
MEPADPAPAPSPEKKSLFDTIVVSTPVLLTVVATFILGRSTSEMTQAQYHRSVAGQRQAKVADEWAFFQAKRIRGTSFETTAVVLAAQKVDPFTADTLGDSADELLAQIEATASKEPKLEPRLLALQKSAVAKRDKIRQAISNVQPALDALQAYPEATADDSEIDDGIDAEQKKILAEVVDDVRKFKPESEIATAVLKLKPDTIDKAIARAKIKAAKVNKRGKDVDRVLEKVDALVEEQIALAREYQRLVRGRLAALMRTNAPATETAELERRLERVRSLSARLLADYKSARYAFDARRYEDDARSNQDAAYLYDVQALRSAAQSDKHLQRSFGFMLAMLVAQVGVTIASLAIMLKYKLPVWAIAALAGIIAIGFGVCVFLEMAPLLG